MYCTKVLIINCISNPKAMFSSSVTFSHIDAVPLCIDPLTFSAGENVFLNLLLVQKGYNYSRLLNLIYIYGSRIKIKNAHQSHHQFLHDIYSKEQYV